MAQPSSTAGPYRKPSANLYTVLLIVALLALIIGCIFLYLEVAEYGPKPFSGAPTVMLPAGHSPLGWLAGRVLG
jgi:hypothetical protein